MTLREFYLQRRKAELPAFMKVLKALPKEQLSYKPDERSPSAEQLVWTLIGSLRACLEIVADGKTAWKPVPPPPLDEMIEMSERFSNELTNSVSQMGDGAWGGTAQLMHARLYRSVWATSYGSLCLMRSTTAASFRHTFDRWAAGYRRSMGPRQMIGRCS